MRRLLLTTAITAMLPIAANALPVIAAAGDPNMFVGPVGFVGVPGGDPNLIVEGATTSFQMGVAGNHTMQGPTLVIFAEPTNATITLTSATCAVTCGHATAGTYGLAANTGTLAAGQFAYAQLGLASGGSESYTNFALADGANNLSVPASFFLVAFAIPDSITGSHDITATETGAPGGTFVFTYSCEVGSTPAGGTCDPPGTIGQTPFTTSALLLPPDSPPPPPPPPIDAPEPASIALLGVGLLGLGFVVSRKRSF